MLLVLISVPVLLLAFLASVIVGGGFPDFSLFRQWDEWRSERKARRIVEEVKRERGEQR